MMEIQMNEPEDGLLDGMFPITEYQAPIRPKRDFLPWHRPRKQFVRQEQWQFQIQALINAPDFESQTLRYLGLPGSDLLDIRHFHENLCRPNHLELLYLGFNIAASPCNPGQTELNISIDEVSKLPGIDTRSTIIPDNFCLIANQRSIAWSRARKLGPFDVINLDLCDGFANHMPGSLDDNYYNAVANLMALQSGRNQPWLLFLTTRTGRQDINQDILKKFISMYLSNLSECASFKAKSQEDFGIASESDLLEVIKTPDGHLSVFLVALCKWMIGLGVGQRPPVRVSVTSTLGYRVSQHADHNDLISIALRFEPTFLAVADPTGIARAEATELDECRLATDIVRRIKNRKCVDTHLHANSDVMEEMVAATSELLELARYDIEEYRVWVQNA